MAYTQFFESLPKKGLAAKICQGDFIEENEGTGPCFSWMLSGPLWGGTSWAENWRVRKRGCGRAAGGIFKAEGRAMSYTKPRWNKRPGISVADESTVAQVDILISSVFTLHWTVCISSTYHVFPTFQDSLYSAIHYQSILIFPAVSYSSVVPEVRHHFQDLFPKCLLSWHSTQTLSRHLQYYIDLIDVWVSLFNWTISSYRKIAISFC